MSGCLGDVAAALVDGELDHHQRERAQAHLLHCPACRAEVEQLRAVKARLTALGAPAVPDALTARLLALPAPGAPVPAPAPVAGTPVRPRRDHPVRGRRHALRRRTALAGSLGLGVVAAALALGGPQGAATTPVDPGTDVFVVQHVDSTGEAPRTVPVTTVGTLTGGPR